MLLVAAVKPVTAKSEHWLPWAEISEWMEVYFHIFPPSVMWDKFWRSLSANRKQSQIAGILCK
jgi:hypothetical protein